MNTEPRSYLQVPPLGLAHRGYSGDVSRGEPEVAENSLQAFANAVELGAQYIETDVRASSDGVPMIFHDDTLERLTSASGPVGKYPHEQLVQLSLPGGQRIPTLAEALEKFPHTRFNIDVKDEGAARGVAEVVEKYQAWNRVLIASFSAKRRRLAVASMAHPVATSGSISSVVRMLLPFPKTSGVDCLQIPAWLARRWFIRRCHRLGLQVHAWTVNDELAMRVLVERGIDGLVSDNVPALLTVLGARR